MLDYFQGIQPTPLGGLTLVYEKYQMGKVQFGFEVNGRACILSAPRKQREKLLQAAAGFYRKNRNAAVTTQIAQTTGSLPAKKRKRSVLKASQSPVQVKAKPMPTKDTEEPEPDSTSKEDVKAIEKPLPPTSFSTKNPQPEALSESQPKESASFKPSGTTVAANAVFFFDMAQRYLSSRDYESACKYAKLARDQGYTGDDLLRVMNQCQAQISTTPSPSANTPSNDKPVLEYAEETPAPKITAPAPSIASQSAPTTNQPYLIEEAEFRNRTEPTTDIRRREFMDQFYSEMDSIEKELEKIKKKKNNLLLLGASGSQLSFVDLLIEGCLLLSLSAGIFYFILSKKVK